MALTTLTASPSVTRRYVMILLLAVAGGAVDAVILMGFGVLTAAQTGNTILLAVSLAQGQFATGMQAALSVVAYIIGAAVGEMVIVSSHFSGARLSPVGRTLAVELIPLTCLFGFWRLAAPVSPGGASAVLVALAAIAMGIQSAAVLRLHAGPTTTYVTGTLTSFTTELIRWLHLTGPTASPMPTQETRNSADLLSSDKPWIYGATWLVYAGGSVVSALLFRRVGAAALALPIAAIVTVVLADTRCP